jgi:8-amino-7-oxononanoate synthase
MKHALGFLVQRVKDSFKCLVCKTVFLPVFDFRKWLDVGGSDLGSLELRDCLVNFAQSFKYTTGLSLRSVPRF